MKSITLRSPAKLNLYLKVLNKRKDGYHSLKTIFERIDLCDEITFRLNRIGRIRIQCRDPQVPLGRKNLVFQAAELLRRECGIAKGADIRIEKHIPVAAGLGGGSSNAATTLMGLNRLWKLSLKMSVLPKLGAKLGADVPFFLKNCSWAMGTERGDSIRPLEIQRKYWHVLIVPRIKLYSSEVFTALNLKLTKRTDNASILIRSLKNNNIKKILHTKSNDLEGGILKVCPKLLSALTHIRNAGLQEAMFSGSGPSIFSLVPTKGEAEALRIILGQRYSRVYVVRTH